MLTFLCYPKCPACKKAKTLLDSYHAQYETRDIKADNPSYDELKSWLALSGQPVRKFFNTGGQIYKSLNLKEKLPLMSEDECLRLLVADGMLVKRPLLVDEFRALAGFKQDEWESVFTEYDRKKLDKIVEGYFNEMLGSAKASGETAGNPKKTKIVNTLGGKVAVMDYNMPIITDGQSALDFFVTIGQAHDCRDTVINKEMLAEDFFRLSSGVAGEIAQKLVSYGFRLAVIGDYSGYASKPLHDFIYESNNGSALYFVSSERDALTKLEAL